MCANLFFVPTWRDILDVNVVTVVNYVWPVRSRSVITKLERFLRAPSLVLMTRGSALNGLLLIGHQSRLSVVPVHARTRCTQPCTSTLTVSDLQHVSATKPVPAIFIIMYILKFGLQIKDQGMSSWHTLFLALGRQSLHLIRFSIGNLARHTTRV